MRIKDIWHCYHQLTKYTLYSPLPKEFVLSIFWSSSAGDFGLPLRQQHNILSTFVYACLEGEWRNGNLFINQYLWCCSLIYCKQNNIAAQLRWSTSFVNREFDPTSVDAQIVMNDWVLQFEVSKLHAMSFIIIIFINYTYIPTDALMDAHTLSSTDLQKTWAYRVIQRKRHFYCDWNEFLSQNNKKCSTVSPVRRIGSYSLISHVARNTLVHPSHPVLWSVGLVSNWPDTPHRARR